MASAKDLFNKLGNSGGGFPKPAPKNIVPTLPPDAEDPKGKAGGGGGTGGAGGKHFDDSQKGHNLKKGAGGAASSGGGSVPTSVRPKV